MNIYFIPGLAANCKVFDRITLPEGYKRQYIEWLIPSEDESIEAYSRRMAKEINTQEAFILAGYSLGGIIIQEMNKFLKPQKSILISSIKGENEIPPLFRLGHRINFAQYFPVDSVIKNDKIVDFFARTIYGTKPEEASEYILYNIIEK
ncbi:hypothetical protein D0T53_13305 [Dysgonomonas sp. 216]|uniref:hypothetical protein n=1 Tax=Dysgonomonas sp. 216 TaxID=2302934 RepID=UPI0013D1B586|nr:hypothetical protein [Dysgonomonas sp. 216]NDW19876.1 hypothetical protein [Dysgonomonas sp. 216]